MARKIALVALICALIAGCARDEGPVRNEFGIYMIGEEQHQFVYDRLLRALNGRRQWAGGAPLRVDAWLSAEARRHASDLAAQNFPTPFGRDGSSPYDRVSRSGFSGNLVAEMYLVADATETQALNTWAEDPAWGLALLDQDATDVGLGWHQNPDGVYWWVMILATAAPAPSIVDPLDPSAPVDPLDPRVTLEPVIDPPTVTLVPSFPAPSGL